MYERIKKQMNKVIFVLTIVILYNYISDKIQMNWSMFGAGKVKRGLVIQTNQI